MSIFPQPLENLAERLRTCTTCGLAQPFANYTQRPSGRVSAVCRPCVKIYNAKYRADNIDRVKEYERRKRAIPLSWARKALARAKMRALVAITVDELLEQRQFIEDNFGGCCPVFYRAGMLVKLSFGTGPLSPASASLDRIDPALGYVLGNVLIISNLANQIKTCATTAQVRAVADFMEAMDESLGKL